MRRGFGQPDCAVKLFLTSVLTFIAVDQQMTAGMIVTGLYLLTVLLAAPYLRSRDDRLSQLVQTEILLLLLLGQVTATQGAPEAGSLADVLLSAVLLAMALAVLLLFLFHSVLAGREYYWRQSRKHSSRRKQHSSSSSTSSSSNPPDKDAAVVELTPKS